MYTFIVGLAWACVGGRLAYGLIKATVEEAKQPGGVSASAVVVWVGIGTVFLLGVLGTFR